MDWVWLDISVRNHSLYDLPSFRYQSQLRFNSDGRTADSAIYNCLDFGKCRMKNEFHFIGAL